MAVAEPVDEVPGLRKQKKGIKTASFLPPSQKKCVVVVDTQWPLDANANAPRLDVAHPPNDHGVVKWGVSRQRSLWGLAKPAMGLPKPSGSINKSVPRKYPINAGVIIFQANGNPMEGNRLIVPLCEKTYKKTFVGLNRSQLKDGPGTQRSPTSLCPSNTTPATWTPTRR